MPLYRAAALFGWIILNKPLNRRVYLFQFDYFFSCLFQRVVLWLLLSLRSLSPLERPLYRAVFVFDPSTFFLLYSSTLAWCYATKFHNISDLATFSLPNRLHRSGSVWLDYWLLIYFDASFFDCCTEQWFSFGFIFLFTLLSRRFAWQNGDEFAIFHRQKRLLYRAVVCSICWPFQHVSWWYAAEIAIFLLKRPLCKTVALIR